MRRRKTELNETISGKQFRDGRNRGTKVPSAPTFYGVTWQPRAEMEALAAALLPALLLGRIDGKSPIEYVTEEREKNQVRDFARRYIVTRVDRLDVIRDAWTQQVHA